MQIGRVFSIFKEIIKTNIVLSAIVNFRHFGFNGLLKMPIFIHYGSKFRDVNPRMGLFF